MNTKYYSLKEYKKSPKNCIVVLTIRFIININEFKKNDINIITFDFFFIIYILLYIF